MARLFKALQFILVASMVIFVCSCATQPKSSTDPYESFNRKTAAFNVVTDNLFFKPLATLYVTITPNVLQAGIHNAFKNIFTVPTVFNDFAQGRLDFAAADTTRILLNSTLGILGFFDIAASHFKLPYHYEDFGMTLAYWGKSNDSKFFVMPLLGPRTFRDAFGFGMDVATNPITYLKPFWVSLAVATAALIDTRAQYLSADPMIDQSFDPYSFVRDAYLQNRQQMIATNNSMQSYRDFQAQQLEGFAPDLTNNDAVDTGMLRVTPTGTTTVGATNGKAPKAKQAIRAYQPPAPRKASS